MEKMDPIKEMRFERRRNELVVLGRDHRSSMQSSICTKYIPRERFRNLPTTPPAKAIPKAFSNNLTCTIFSLVAPMHAKNV